MINDVTLELFNFLSSKNKLSDEDKQRIYLYFSFILNYRFLSEDEKYNVLLLLDFLDEFSQDLQDFKKLIKVIRSRMLFKAKQPWEGCEDLFPENYIIEQGGKEYTPAELKYSNIPQISFFINKPIRSSTDYAAKIIMSSDGEVEIDYVYKIYDESKIAIEGMPLLNSYGEKTVNYKEY